MERITVKNRVKVPVKKVWELWTNPEHIVKWNTASEDWHTTKAENDLRVGGKFMSSGSLQFSNDRPLSLDLIKRMTNYSL